MPRLLRLKAPPVALDLLQPSVTSACLGCSRDGINLLLSPRSILLSQLGQTPTAPLLCNVQHLSDNRHPLEQGVGRAGVQSVLHLAHLLASLLRQHGYGQRLQQQQLSPSNSVEPAAADCRVGLRAGLDALADLVPASVECIAHPQHHHPFPTGKRRETSSNRTQRTYGHRLLVALSGPLLPELVGERLVLWVINPRHRLELDLRRELDERSPAVGPLRILFRGDLQGTSVRRPVGCDGDCCKSRVDDTCEGHAQLEAIGRATPQHVRTHDEHSLLVARLRKQRRRGLSVDVTSTRGARGYGARLEERVRCQGAGRVTWA